MISYSVVLDITDEGKSGSAWRSQIGPWSAACELFKKHGEICGCVGDRSARATHPATAREGGGGGVEEGWRRGGAEEETEGQAAIFNLGSEVSGTWPRHFSKRMILLPSVSKLHNLLNMHQQIACTKKCPCIFFHHKGLKKCNSVKPGPKIYGKEN